MRPYVFCLPFGRGLALRGQFDVAALFGGAFSHGSFTEGFFDMSSIGADQERGSLNAVVVGSDVTDVLITRINFLTGAQASVNLSQPFVSRKPGPLIVCIA